MNEVWIMIDILFDVKFVQQVRYGAEAYVY